MDTSPQVSLCIAPPPPNVLKASVLVVGQAHSYVQQVFDVVDTVVKEHGVARIDSAP